MSRWPALRRAGTAAITPAKPSVPQRAIHRARSMAGQLRLAAVRLDRYAPRSPLDTEAGQPSLPSAPVVDAHNHLGRWLNGDGSWMAPSVPALLADMDALRIAAMVNLDGRWGAELEENLDRYDRAHPGRFVTFCHLPWARLRQRDAATALVSSLAESAAAGAGGIKVWKDLGLSVRDGSGRLVLPDDPRLDDVWAAAGELRLPVLVHVADPVTFFQPADRHNERLEELLRHPGWSKAALGTGHYDRLLGALEAVVARHPGTTFIAAHVACRGHDLPWVSRMLDAYPNLCVDIAASLSELGRQPRAAAALIRRHADRVVFGTDSFPFDPAQLLRYVRALETEDEYFSYTGEPVPPQGRWAISALALPPEVLDRLYSGNARRLIPALATARVSV